MRLVSVCGKVLYSIKSSKSFSPARRHNSVRWVHLQGTANERATPVPIWSECTAQVAPGPTPQEHTAQCVRARVSLELELEPESGQYDIAQVLAVRRNQGLGLRWPGSGGLPLLLLVK